MTISQCHKYCQYFNYKIVASGKFCFCLNGTLVLNKTTKVADSNCYDINSFDKHLSGSDSKYGVYRLMCKLNWIRNKIKFAWIIFLNLAIDKSSIPMIEQPYLSIGEKNVFFHQIIIEMSNATLLSCFSACFYLGQIYAAYENS